MLHAVPRRLKPTPLGRRHPVDLASPLEPPASAPRLISMTKHVRATGAPAALVLMVLLSSCQPSGAARMVDCVKGYHNIAGSGSRCVPDATTQTTGR